MIEYDHPPMTQLANYLDGLLLPEEVEAVEAHLVTNCARCSAELAWLEETMALMTTDEWVEPSPQVVANAMGQLAASRPGKQSWLSAIFTRPRMWALSGFAVVVLLVVGAVFFFAPEPAIVTMPTDIMGRVEVFPAGKQNTEVAQLDSPLGRGDTIRTGNESSVTLPLFASETELGANTEVVIDELEENTSESDQIVSLFQMAGYSRYRVAELPSPNSHFIIRTPAGVIMAQSANFTIDVQDDGSVELFVVNGAVSYEEDGGVVIVPAGQPYILTTHQPPATPTLAITPTTASEEALPPTTTTEPLISDEALLPTATTNPLIITTGNWYAELSGGDFAGCLGLTVSEATDRHPITFAITHNSQPLLGQAALVGSLRPESQFTLPLDNDSCLVTGLFSNATTVEGDWSCQINGGEVISGQWVATPLATICELP